MYLYFIYSASEHVHWVCLIPWILHGGILCISTLSTVHPNMFNVSLLCLQCILSNMFTASAGFPGYCMEVFCVSLLYLQCILTCSLRLHDSLDTAWRYSMHLYFIYSASCLICSMYLYSIYSASCLICSLRLQDSLDTAWRYSVYLYFIYSAS